jgi:tripartite-type tricarboxylate transporter receptor subunit TctC
MKIAISLLFLISSWVYANPETIRIQTPYTASHSGTSAMLRIIEIANRMQRDYVFMLEFRPGGNQVIAVRQMEQDPQTNLAIIAASYVENIEVGWIKPTDYVPVWSLGDACWTVMSIVSTNNTVSGLRPAQEIIVGTVGVGNATHLTALLIGKQYGIPVKLVPFKSNFDAVINMIGNNGVNFGIDTPEAYENFRDKNPQLRMLAVSCSSRLVSYPGVRTLAEQGIPAPTVFNIVVVRTEMPDAKRKRLAQILEQATAQIGQSEIERMSGFVPPQFYKVTAQEHFTKSTDLIRQLRIRFQTEIATTK